MSTPLTFSWVITLLIIVARRDVDGGYRRFSPHVDARLTPVAVLELLAGAAPAGLVAAQLLVLRLHDGPGRLLLRGGGRRRLLTHGGRRNPRRARCFGRLAERRRLRLAVAARVVHLLRLARA